MIACHRPARDVRDATNLERGKLSVLSMVAKRTGVNVPCPQMKLSQSVSQSVWNSVMPRAPALTTVSKDGSATPTLRV